MFGIEIVIGKNIMALRGHCNLGKHQQIENRHNNTQNTVEVEKNAANAQRDKLVNG